MGGKYHQTAGFGLAANERVDQFAAAAIQRRICLIQQPHTARRGHQTGQRQTPPLPSRQRGYTLVGLFEQTGKDKKIFARARAMELQLLLGRTSLAPLNDVIVALCIGDRVAVENWKCALLALRFVIKLRKLLRSAC